MFVKCFGHPSSGRKVSHPVERCPHRQFRTRHHSSKRVHDGEPPLGVPRGHFSNYSSFLVDTDTPRVRGPELTGTLTRTAGAYKVACMPLYGR